MPKRRIELEYGEETCDTCVMLRAYHFPDYGYRCELFGYLNQRGGVAVRDPKCLDADKVVQVPALDGVVHAEFPEAQREHH